MKFEEDDHGNIIFEEGTSVSRVREKIRDAKLVLGVEVSSIVVRSEGERDRNRAIVFSVTYLDDIKLGQKRTARFLFKPSAFAGLARILRNSEIREFKDLRFRKRRGPRG